MNDDLEPNNEARALTADLIARLSLNADGEPAMFDEDGPDSWAAADAAQPEIVRLGAVRFKIVGDGEELAMALGALDADELPAICLHVAFEEVEGVPVPMVGQFIVVRADDAGVVSVVFEVRANYELLRPGPDEPDLGPDAVRNPVCDLLPGEAVLVQVFDSDEEVDYAAR